MAPDDKTPDQMPESDTGPKNPYDGYMVGINFFTSMIVGGVMGYGLDYLFGTKPWFMFLFFILGFVAGMRTIWAYMNKQT